MDIQGKVMERFLSNIALGDIIKECVIHSSDQSMTCISVDMTSQVYSHITCPVGLGDFVLGIGDIPMLLSYFKNAGDAMVSVKKADNRLTCTTAGTRAILRYMLSAPETIPTVPVETHNDGEDYEWVQNFAYKLRLQPGILETYLKNANIVKPNITKFRVSPGKGRCLAIGGTPNETQFDVLFGEASVAPGSTEYTQQFTTNMLTKVFNAVMAGGGDTHMHFCNEIDDQGHANGALGIFQDTNLWVISPLVTAEGE